MPLHLVEQPLAQIVLLEQADGLCQRRKKSFTPRVLNGAP